MAAPLGDQSQRALRHHALIVESAPPADWRDVAVLVRRRIAREGEFLAERCPRVGVGAAFEQQTRERLVPNDKRPPQLVEALLNILVAGAGFEPATFGL